MNRIPRRWAVFGILLPAFVGCGGPSSDQRENRKSLEHLLTAITLRNVGELEKDARRIEDRYAAGLLSDVPHRDLLGIVKKGREGEWSAAEELAYKFRDSQPFPR